MGGADGSLQGIGIASVCPQPARLSSPAHRSQSYDYTIPIVHISGRSGLDLDLTLYYNSRAWNIDWTRNQATFNADRDFPSYGFRLGYGLIEYDSSNSEWALIESDGTKRQLAYTATNIYVTTDASYITWNSSTNIVYYKSGTRIFYQAFPSQATLFRPTKIEDTNGNYISISYRTDTWAQGQEINTITDTIGHVITFNYDTTTHVLSSIVQGSVTYITFTWRSDYVFAYNFSGLTVVNSPALNATLTVLTGCTYPNGTQYAFTYGGWGIVTEVQHLSSSSQVRNSITYDFPTAATALTDAPSYAHQSVFDGVQTNSWTYATTLNGHNVTSTAVTDPMGTTTKSNFDATTGLLTSVTVASGGSTLRTIANTWNTGTNPTLASSTVTLNDSGQQSKMAFLYDSYANVREVQEYDYGVRYIRRTTTTYQTASGYISAHIYDRPTSVSIYDETGVELLKARTDFVYDGATPSTVSGSPAQWDSTISTNRGNVTTVKRYETPSGPSGEIDRNFQYDQLGNLIQADLDCCTRKIWTFDSTTNWSYPVTITSGGVPQLTVSPHYS